MKDSRFAKPKVFVGIIILLRRVAAALCQINNGPPTNYFPLIVRDALMIEPTETENKETLDTFVEAILQIADEARDVPEQLRESPHRTPVCRLDEVKAARELIVTDRKMPCPP
jgi:glycine dehydrogenase subunit 2